MKYLLFFLFISSSQLYAQVDTSQHIVEGRRNSAAQQNKPYVILISADGFRYDYAKKYKAQHILALTKKGVTATSMAPVFPSLTFPNHYSIATGMYPAHHGIVNNNFYDAARNSSYGMSKRSRWKTAAGMLAYRCGYWQNSSKCSQQAFIGWVQKHQ